MFFQVSDMMIGPTCSNGWSAWLQPPYRPAVSGLQHNHFDDLKDDPRSGMYYLFFNSNRAYKISHPKSIKKALLMEGKYFQG